MKTKKLLLGSAVICVTLLAIGVLVIPGLEKIPDKQEHARFFVDHGLVAPLNKFKLDIGRYPTSDEGLSALVAPPLNVSGKWKGPYLDEIPLDPWGSAYVYRAKGDPVFEYQIVSLGPDGTESDDDLIGKKRRIVTTKPFP